MRNEVTVENDMRELRLRVWSGKGWPDEWDCARGRLRRFARRVGVPFVLRRKRGFWPARL